MFINPSALVSNVITPASALGDSVMIYLCPIILVNINEILVSNIYFLIPQIIVIVLPCIAVFLLSNLGLLSLNRNSSPMIGNLIGDGRNELRLMRTKVFEGSAIIGDHRRSTFRITKFCFPQHIGDHRRCCKSTISYENRTSAIMGGELRFNDNHALSELTITDFARQQHELLSLTPKFKAIFDCRLRKFSQPVIQNEHLFHFFSFYHHLKHTRSFQQINILLTIFL